jgi:hypothetical protein
VYTEDIINQLWENLISWNQTNGILDFTWIIDQTILSLTGENQLSWVNQTPAFVPFLRFVEIFPKDTPYYGEYLLITTTQQFSWTIRIIWVWTSSTEKQIAVTLEANKPCVFTDRPELLRTWNGQCLYYIPSMTLTDSGEPLEIRVWSTLHQKIIYTSSSDSMPLHWWWIINEWWYEHFTLSLPFSVLSKKDMFIWTWNNWTWLLLSWNNTQTTWNYLSGDTFLSWNNNNQWTWIILTWINSDTINTFLPIQIEEIYPFDTEFAEYVEIIALQNRKGEITLQWWWQWSASKTFFVDTFSWVRRIITDDKNRFTNYPFIIELDSLSLTDWWEQLVLLLPNGQEIDKVVYFWQSKKQSWLSSDISTWSARLFSLLQPPTPGYIRSMIQHHFQTIDTSQIPICSVYLQHTKPIYVTNKVNLQAMVDGVLIQNSITKYQCERLLSWSDTQYLTWCNPSYLSFEVWVQPIHLRVSENELVYCETTAFLNLPLEKIPVPKTTKEQTEDKPSYYETLYRKRKWRFDHLSRQVKWYGYKVNSSGDITWVPEKIEIPELITGAEPPTVLIHHILPNPKWKDSIWEEILLENKTEEEIFSDNLLVVRGKSSKWLPKWHILPPNVPVLITGDIWLVNKPSCFQLRTRQEKKVVSTLCYPQIAEWVLYTWNLVTFSSPAEQERLQDLKLTLTDTQACVWIGVEQVLCKDLFFSTLEAKQRKKDSKKLVSLNKKLLNFQEKYTLRREKYAKQSASYKKKESTLLLKNRTLRTDISKQKKLTSRFRRLYRLIRTEVWKEFTPLFSSPVFKNLALVYETLEISDKSDILTLWPIQFPIQEVDALYDLYAHGTLPLEFSDNALIKDYIMSWTQNIKTLLWTLF